MTQVIIPPAAVIRTVRVGPWGIPQSPSHPHSSVIMIHAYDEPQGSSITCLAARSCLPYLRYPTYGLKLRGFIVGIPACYSAVGIRVGTRTRRVPYLSILKFNYGNFGCCTRTRRNSYQESPARVPGVSYVLGTALACLRYYRTRTLSRSVLVAALAIVLVRVLYWYIRIPSRLESGGTERRAL